MNDDIDTLVNELTSFEMPSLNTKKANNQEFSLQKEDVEQYFLDKTKAVIEASVGAVQDLTQSTVAGGDAKDVEALSKLVSSTAQMLDTLNKISLIDKKADRDEQLEYIKIQGKKEISLLNQKSKEITNNNVIITSREEIMKKLFGKESSQIYELDNK